MANLNRVTVMGVLGRDPETKTFPNGGSITTFSVATSEHWGKSLFQGHGLERPLLSLYLNLPLVQSLNLLVLIYVLFEVDMVDKVDMYLYIHDFK